VGVGVEVAVGVGEGVLVGVAVGVEVTVGVGVSLGRNPSATASGGVGRVGVLVGKAANASRSGVGNAIDTQLAITISAMPSKTKGKLGCSAPLSQPRALRGDLDMPSIVAPGQRAVKTPSPHAMGRW
jgi:hypothetical protein